MASDSQGWWCGATDGRWLACNSGRITKATGGRGGSDYWRRLPLQAPCSIPLSGLRHQRAAVRESLPGDPGRLQKTSLPARSGLWAASEGMVRGSPADTPTVFLSGKALSPISPSRVGCIGWRKNSARCTAPSLVAPARPPPAVARFPKQTYAPNGLPGQLCHCAKPNMDTRTTTAPVQHSPLFTPPHRS